MNNDSQSQPSYSISVLDVLPSCSHSDATMEGTVAIDTGVGEKIYMFTFHHNGSTLRTDGETGNSAEQLIEDLQMQGLSEHESFDLAWKIMRDTAKSMYQVVAHSSLYQPGMDRFELGSVHC